jgi:hypothetical protein
MDAYITKKSTMDQDSMFLVGKVALYMACKLVHASNFEQKYSFEYFEEVLNQNTEFTQDQEKLGLNYLIPSEYYA